ESERDRVPLLLGQGGACVAVRAVSVFKLARTALAEHRRGWRSCDRAAPAARVCLLSARVCERRGESVDTRVRCARESFRDEFRVRGDDSAPFVTGACQL